MQQIGQYLLRLTAAALVCGIATAFFGDKGTFGGVIKVLAGIYLTLHIVSPWVQIRLDEWLYLSNSISASAENIGLQGQNAARDAMAESISQSACAYILDKAKSLDAELTVEVFLDEADIPAPCRVRIRGNVSPYAKKMLSAIIEEDLGIPLEEQIWI